MSYLLISRSSLTSQYNFLVFCKSDSRKCFCERFVEVFWCQSQTASASYSITVRMLNPRIHADAIRSVLAPQAWFHTVFSPRFAWSMRCTRDAFLSLQSFGDIYEHLCATPLLTNKFVFMQPVPVFCCALQRECPTTVERFYKLGITLATVLKT